MALNFKNIFVGLRFRPVTTLTSDKLGEVQSFLTDNKTYLHNGTTRSPLLTEAQTATITNKSISADTNTISELEVDNLKAGVLNTSTTLAGASDLQVPSALAVKTYVDDTFSPQTDVADLVTLTGVPANSTDLGTFTGTTIPDDQTIKEALQSLETGLETHISDAVDAHDASAISSIPSGNLSATDVQSALDELQTDIDTRALDTALQAHINDTVDAHDASAISVTPFPGIVSTDVQSALVELEAQIVAGGTGDVSGPASSTDNAIARFDSTTGKIIQNSVVTVSDTGVIAGASIDADTNAITNIENADIKTGAAIDRSKLASGTANAVVHNDGSGVMSNSTDLLVGTNALTLANTKHLELQAATDSTTTGAAASLTAFTAGGIRLTNASLVSIANIPAGTNGQELLIFNRTGADVTVSDSSAALGTAANRILTGTNGTITFTNNAALLLSYDSTTQRWQIVGGTGSGTGSSASLDTILQLTASEQLTDWSTGDNATFLGGGTLAGTFVKETTTPLHGTASYKYTQAAGSLDDYLASVVFPVDLRFRGQQVYFSAPIQYDGNTGDIQIIVYCATTSTVLTTTSNTVIGTNGSTQTVIASCVIPLTCTGIRVGFQVKTLNSGKVLQFDDIQVGQSLYQAAQLNNVTDWTSAGLSTADFIGFGTVTNIEIQSRRSGPNLEYRGKFTSGTPTAVEARISLKLAGAQLTSGSTSIIPSIQVVGKGNNVIVSSVRFSGLSVLIEPSVNYITIGKETSTTDGLTKSTGDTITNPGQTVSFFASIPIQGWSAGNTAIVTPTQQISSDTLPFTFKATAIVDADPIGTFNTYTYAANTNTATISASAPTQTVSDMNTNGIRVYARAYNALSTTALPARADIKIGKGLKSTQIDAYVATAKASPFSYNTLVNGVNEYGSIVVYNEATGILSINIALAYTVGNTAKFAGIQYDTGTLPTAGYFVFNASTTPSIAALPILQPRIATLSDVKASGTAGGSSSAATTHTRTLNTLVDPTGIVTSLTANQFVLPAGTYYFESSVPASGVVNGHKARLRNITDGTTSIIGTSEFASTATGICSNKSLVTGEITITSAKTFELQHYTATARATDGLGSAASSGESEVYSIVKITKVR